MPSLRRVSAALLFAALGNCGSGSTEPDPGATFRILFVGNSLTYVNELPAMVKALADSSGVESTYVEMVAEPDYALEDHWRDGEVQKRLRRGGWDYVVMQQGPSALPESRAHLLQWTATLSAEIRKAGAEPVLYMVWPATSRAFDFDRVSESYRLAAESVNGLLAPVGEAWRAAWRRDASLALYGPDGFHPSARGTYTAALVIYATLYRRPATGLPTGLTLPGGSVRFSDAEAALLQSAADEVAHR